MSEVDKARAEVARWRRTRGYNAWHLKRYEVALRRLREARAEYLRVVLELMYGDR